MKIVRKAEGYVNFRFFYVHDRTWVVFKDSACSYQEIGYNNRRI